MLGYWEMHVTMGLVVPRSLVASRRTIENCGPSFIAIIDASLRDFFFPLKDRSREQLYDN